VSRQPEGKKGYTKAVSGSELIGDREVDYIQYFDLHGETYIQYGKGPSYLCRSARDGRWWISFDYTETIIERQLSRRRKRKQGAKAEWENYLLESAVEYWHVKLANNPKHRVAGDSEKWRRVIHEKVDLAIRGLDTEPLDQLKAALGAVRLFRQLTTENELVMLTILAACRAHQSVPYRSEVFELLGADVPIGREKSTLHERLMSLGFGWLPGGRPRKPKRSVRKIRTGVRVSC